MPRMTGGDAIVDSLLRHGIDTIFGLPGVQMYGLFDAFARNANRLRVLNARHEQTTAYMAMGYAQSTGKPSAFTVVPGPGVMNTMGALTTAWGTNAPIMCITGQVPSAMIGRGRGQLHEMPDQLATLKTLLKFAERIEHPTEAPQVMARAFQAMISGRPGPVAVEMPWDMFPASADVTPIDPLGKRANPVPDPDKIAALAKLVDGARAPMIWVGGGAVDAGPEILALAEKIGAPVVSFRMGKGVVDSRHPLSLNTRRRLRAVGQDRPADRHRHAPRHADRALGAGAGRPQDRAHRHRPGRASAAAGRRGDRGRRRRRRACPRRRRGVARTIRRAQPPSPPPRPPRWPRSRRPIRNTRS